MLVLSTKKDIDNLRLSKKEKNIKNFLKSYFTFLCSYYEIDSSLSDPDLMNYGPIYYIEDKKDWEDYKSFKLINPITEENFVSASLITGNKNDTKYISSLLIVNGIDYNIICREKDFKFNREKIIYKKGNT